MLARTPYAGRDWRGPTMPALWYPEAQRRPLGEQTEPLMRAYDLVMLHTMVMSLWDCDRYFMAGGYGGNESHLGVGHDGETLQWQDFAHQSDACYEGNPRAITIETADRGEGFPPWDPNDGSAVPAWTPAQVDRLPRIVAWCCREFDIPCVAAPDSRPGSRGVAWHRQGVESVPPHRDGYRVPGGEFWSLSKGKVCPGSRRIAQIPEVIKRAQAILAGDGEDDMSEKAEEQINALATQLLQDGYGGNTVPKGQKTLGAGLEKIVGLVESDHNELIKTNARLDAVQADLAEIKTMLAGG